MNLAPVERCLFSRKSKAVQVLSAVVKTVRLTAALSTLPSVLGVTMNVQEQWQRFCGEVTDLYHSVVFFFLRRTPEVSKDVSQNIPEVASREGEEADTSSGEVAVKPLPDGCRPLDETVVETPAKNRIYGPFLLPEPSGRTRQKTKNTKKKLRHRTEYLQWVLDGRPAFKPAPSQSSVSLSHVLESVSPSEQDKVDPELGLHIEFGNCLMR